MRDFTYIDDIVTGIQKIIEKPAVSGQYKLYNIGNSNPIKLLDFIETLEHHLGKKAKKKMYPMQDGDVYKTYASVEKLKKAVGYEPSTDLDEGIRQFVTWYKEYYGYH